VGEVTAKERTEISYLAQRHCHIHELKHFDRYRSEQQPSHATYGASALDGVRCRHLWSPARLLPRSHSVRRAYRLFAGSLAECSRLGHNFGFDVPFLLCVPGRWHCSGAIWQIL